MVRKAATMVSAGLVGDAKLERLLTRMRVTSARRALNLGLRKSVQQAAKDIKKAIPGKYKQIKKGIGYRNLKGSEAPGGGAMVGLNVGRASKATSQKERQGRKGMGIDSANIHWWFLGTGPRFNGVRRRTRKTASGKTRRTTRNTGGSVRYTGKMPPQEKGIQVLVNRNKGKYARIIREWTDKGINIEIGKGKAF